MCALRRNLAISRAPCRISDSFPAGHSSAEALFAAARNAGSAEICFKASHNFGSCIASSSERASNAWTSSLFGSSPDAVCISRPRAFHSSLGSAFSLSPISPNWANISSPKNCFMKAESLSIITTSISRLRIVESIATPHCASSSILLIAAIARVRSRCFSSRAVRCSRNYCGKSGTDRSKTSFIWRRLRPINLSATICCNRSRSRSA